MQAENPANRILYTDKGTGNGDAMNRTRFKLNQNRAPIHELWKFPAHESGTSMCQDIKEEEESGAY